MRRVPKGRPKGRELTDLEVEYLKLVLDVRARDSERLSQYDDRLADFVLRCREMGASARSMADQLGVSPSSIQHWTVLGRRRKPVTGVEVEDG